MKETCYANLIFYIIELVLPDGLKEGDIPSLLLADRKWGTGSNAGNIELDIPDVKYCTFCIISYLLM